jgi:hypothetical protein
VLSDLLDGMNRPGIPGTRWCESRRHGEFTLRLIVNGLCFGLRDVADRPQQALVAQPVDPIERGQVADTPDRGFDAGGAAKLSTFIPLQIRKRGVRKLVIRADGESASATARGQFDSPMLVALARAFYWQQLLDEGVVASGTDIAQREGLHHSTVNELLRLTLLKPAIIQAILAGKQPRCMSLIWFQRNPLPLDWIEQQRVVEAFDS